MIGRRAVLGAAAAACLAPRSWAQASTLRDDAGRPIAIPAKVERIVPAGPPAAILLYTLAPDLMAGWTRTPGPAEREFLLPDIAARPEIGRITGRGNTASLEAVLAAKPSLILDVGSTSGTYVSLAVRVQEQTGIPYALLDGRLDGTPKAYRLLGRMIGREQRAEELAVASEQILDRVRNVVAQVPAEKRPRVYYARGPRGLETARGSSINVESLALLGAVNVAGREGAGMASVSIEQVLIWDPDVIVTIDRDFARQVGHDPVWASVRAVRDKRVHLAPMLPFGWIDFPPSVNRLVGLPWLGKVFYPELFADDVTALARDFHRRFYHVAPSDAALARLLGPPA